MADSVVKLRIDSKEYDANIRRAGEALSNYMRQVREGGGTLSVLDDGVMEAVQALGQLGTKAEGARGGLRELTQTITDLTVEYRALTDEEKNTPFGREMIKAIDQLTDRAGNIRDAMGDVQGAINNVASDTRAFDQMAQGVSIATSAFQGLTGAGKLLGINMGDNLAVIAKLQAAMAVTNSLTTIQNALQSQSALMQGVVALQTKAAAIAQSLLAKNTIAATVAQRAFNVAAKANPVGLVVGTLVAATVAIVAFSEASSQASQREKDEREVRIQQMQREKAERDRLAQKAKAEAETIATAAGEKIAKYEMLRNAWSQLQTEQQKSTFIRENANLFSELGLSINSSADAMKAFVTNSAKVIEALDSMARAEALKDLLKDAYKQQYSTLPPDRRQYQPTTTEMRYYAPSALQRRRGAFMGQWKEIPQEEIDRHIDQYINSQEWAKQAGIGRGDFSVTPNRLTGDITFSLNAAGTSKMQEYRYQTGTQKIQDENNSTVERLKNLLNTTTQESLKKQTEAGVFTTPNFTTTTTPTKGGNTTRELTKEQQIQQQINNLVDESVDATEERAMQIREEVAELQRMQQVIKQRKDFVLGTDKNDTTQNINIKTESGMSAYIQGIRKQLSEANFGSDIYQSLSNSLADTSMLQSLVGESLRLGLGTAMFDAADELGRDFWTRAMEGGVENVDWETILAKINEKRKELGLEELTADYQTGTTSSKPKEKKDDKTDEKKEVKLSDAIGQIGSGLSGITSGLDQLGIEVPQGLQNVVNGIQAVTSILTAISTIVSTISSLVAADVIKFFAGGGIVPRFAGGGLIGNAALGMTIPGRSYSGDLLRLPVDGGRGMIGVNSGEVILNQAQAGVLESELNGSRMRDINVHGVVQGENIVLAVRNYLRRTGKGEAAMWGKNN